MFVVLFYEPFLQQDFGMPSKEIPTIEDADIYRVDFYADLLAEMRKVERQTEIMVNMHESVGSKDFSRFSPAARQEVF